MKKQKPNGDWVHYVDITPSDEKGNRMIVLCPTTDQRMYESHPDRIRIHVIHDKLLLIILRLNQTAEELLEELKDRSSDLKNMLANGWTFKSMNRENQRWAIVLTKNRKIQPIKIKDE